MNKHTKYKKINIKLLLVGTLLAVSSVKMSGLSIYFHEILDPDDVRMLAISLEAAGIHYAGTKEDKPQKPVMILELTSAIFNIEYRKSLVSALVYLLSELTEHLSIERTPVDTDYADPDDPCAFNEDFSHNRFQYRNRIKNDGDEYVYLSCDWSKWKTNVPKSIIEIMSKLRVKELHGALCFGYQEGPSKDELLGSTIKEATTGKVYARDDMPWEPGRV